MEYFIALLHRIIGTPCTCHFFPNGGRYWGECRPHKDGSTNLEIEQKMARMGQEAADDYYCQNMRY